MTMKKTSFVLAGLLMAANVHAQDNGIALESGYLGEAARESKKPNESAHQVAAKLKINFENADRDGFQGKIRTGSSIAIGIGEDSLNRRAQYMAIDSKTMLSLETPRLGPVRAVLAVDAQLDYRRAGLNNPMRSRNRPTISGGLGVRVTTDNLDLVIVPEVGVNVMNQSTLVGGRVMLDLNRVFANVAVQYEFAKDFNAANTDTFFVDLETGVKLVCFAGGGKKSAAEGFCLSLYGEVEYLKHQKTTPFCGACGTSLVYREEISYGGGLQFRF
jgi:hypothetical protein